MGLQIFQFDGEPVRVVEIDGEPNFVGKDVAERLGYADPANAMKQHCKGVVKRHPLLTPGGVQEVRVLLEPDVLRLIIGSRLTAAERFERLVFEEILPTIRRTGSYGVPLSTSPAQQLLAMAQIAVDLERTQDQHTAALIDVNARVSRVEASQTVLSSCPAAAESISRIRGRMNKRHGLSAATIDAVMRQSPYAPKPAGMVKNEHAEADGSTYAIFWKKDVTATFDRFVSECTMVTATQATHPFVEGRFRVTSSTGEALVR